MRKNYSRLNNVGNFFVFLLTKYIQIGSMKIGYQFLIIDKRMYYLCFVYK